MLCGPAEPPCGVARQRLLLEHAPVELDLGRRRRCRGLRRRLRVRLGYVLTGRGSRLGANDPPTSGAGFPMAVFLCHSFRLLTLPLRPGSAMLASAAPLPPGQALV